MSVPPITNIVVYRDGVPETGNDDLDAEALSVELPKEMATLPLRHLQQWLGQFRTYRMCRLRLISSFSGHDCVIWDKDGGFPQDVRASASAGEELFRLYGDDIPACAQQKSECILIAKYE